MRCAIWYHLCNIKNVKNTNGGVLILVTLQVKACNFTKIDTPPRVFFTFFKLYKWYQIAQRITYLKWHVTSSSIINPSKLLQSLLRVLFQVLINVKVAGVNTVDIYIRSGTNVIKPTLPYIPGKGGAGIVQQLGEAVTKVKVTGLSIS